MQHIRDALVSQLATLQGRGDTIAIADLTQMLEHIAKTLDENDASADSFLRDEIVKIVQHIETAKREIVALMPESETGQDMGTVALQLDAVIRATEEAAGSIMDAADEIQSLASDEATDPALREKLTAITARIYEACNFQDLTSQRITKVMRALEFTESRVRRLVSLFSSDGSLDVEAVRKVEAENKDANLMNGPQLPGQAPSQADIDAMFGT
jgi:chemotaxis protein CheZ